MLDDFGPSSSTTRINDNGESPNVKWESDPEIVNTDDLFQKLSSDENDVVDNITVDIGKQCSNYEFTKFIFLRGN